MTRICHRTNKQFRPILYRRFSGTCAKIFSIKLENKDEKENCRHICCFRLRPRSARRRYVFHKFHVMMSRLIDFSIGLDCRPSEFTPRAPASHITCSRHIFLRHSALEELLFSCWLSPRRRIKDLKIYLSIPKRIDNGCSSHSCIHTNEPYSKPKTAEEKSLGSFKAFVGNFRSLNILSPAKTRTSSLIALLRLNDVSGASEVRSGVANGAHSIAEPQQPESLRGCPSFELTLKIRLDTDIEGGELGPL